MAASVSKPPTIQDAPSAAMPSEDLLAAFAPSYRVDTLDEIDAKFIREAIVIYDQLEGPRIGDFVRFHDGSLSRIAVDYGERGFQTMEPHRGAFYLGGTLNLSCGSLSFTPFLDKAKLTPTPETQEGGVWTFHHREAVPGGRVNAVTPFRVYSYPQQPFPDDATAVAAAVELRRAQ